MLATLLTATDSRADCAAAPIGGTNDMVVSFLAANGTQVSAASLMASTVKEGMLVYDVTEKTLKLCDGTDWIAAANGIGVSGLDKQVQFNDNGDLAGSGDFLFDKTSKTVDVNGTVSTKVLFVKATTGSLPPPTGGAVVGAGMPGGTVTGAVQFRSPTGIFAADDTGLFWNDTDNRLGIGTATPQSALQVAGGVQVGDDTTTCPGTTNEKLGTVRFNAGALSVCISSGWSALTAGGITAETDPKIGTLANGKWCVSDGATVICNTNPPVLTEADPKIGTLTASKWCSTNGTTVTCTQNAPVLAEADPKISTLTAGKYCTTDGSTVACTANAPSGTVSGTANKIAKFTSTTAVGDSVLTESGGLVGIGTTSPGYRLHVSGSGCCSGAVMAIQSTGGGGGTWGFHSTDSSYGEGGNHLLIANGGVKFNLDASGNLILTGALTQNSDIRLKTEIEGLTDTYGLEAISKLRPVTFKWRDPQSAGRQIGFIAQNVEDVLPELVRNSGTRSDETPDGALTLNYQGIIPPLVKAVQQLEAMNDALAEELSQLRKELEAIKATQH